MNGIVCSENNMCVVIIKFVHIHDGLKIRMCVICKPIFIPCSCLESFDYV